MPGPTLEELLTLDDGWPCHITHTNHCWKWHFACRLAMIRRHVERMQTPQAETRSPTATVAEANL